MPVIWGTAAADAILGSTGADQIYGQAGNDTLYGSGGDDLLNGGLGNDLMGGGLGNDVYYVAAAGDAIVERVGEGTDSVLAWISYQLAANVEALILQGATAINGTGNGLNNTIIGNTGNNVLNGDAGSDTLAGGKGDDIYDVDSVGDRAQEAANEGYDRVRASVSFTLGANLEELSLTGTAAINGTGNALANTITGNAGNNLLNGAVGDDLLIGGKGNDIYYVAAAGDRVVEQAGEGTDQVLAWISHQLAANVEILVLQGTSAINGTGNALNNTIIGNAGDNVLDGGAGSDTLAGGKGNDIYDVDSAGDRAQEAANEGYDRVRSAVSFALGANIEELNLTGVAAINGIGNALNNIIIGNAGNNVLNGGTGNDTLVGGDGGDIYDVDSAGDRVQEASGGGRDLVRSSVSFALSANLEELTLTGTVAINGTGNALANTITGNAGNNVLNGAAGDDLLTGGKGNDIYYVAAGGDRVVEQAGEGTDQVLAWIGHQLAANVEILVLQGTAAINGIGNALGNTIVGNAAENALDGGTGDDVLTGGDGNDQLQGGAGKDKLIGGDGSDRLDIRAGDPVSGETYDGGAGMDTLSLTPYLPGPLDFSQITLSGIENFSGSVNAVSMTAAQLGGFQNVHLFQATLTIVGGGVADLSDGTNVDVYRFQLSDQGNTLILPGSATFGAFVNGGAGNDVVIAPAGYASLYGNGGDDTLTGGKEADRLDGGSGSDRMIGGAGNDRYEVDSTGDQAVELANGGTDEVLSSVSFTLDANVENLILTGTHPINATGNDRSNTLAGNSAANTLSGGAGNDIIHGGAGADTLSGGAGADIFDFQDGGGDTVLDFSRAQGDKLALWWVGGFTYLGTAAFTATWSTQARFSDGHLLVDAVGDGVADFAVNLSGITSAAQLQASDFIFTPI